MPPWFRRYIYRPVEIVGWMQTAINILGWLGFWAFVNQYQPALTPELSGIYVGITFILACIGTVAVENFLSGIGRTSEPPTGRNQRLSDAINRLAELRQEGNAIIQLCSSPGPQQDSDIEREFEAWVQRIRDFLHQRISTGRAMEARLGDQQGLTLDFMQFGGSPIRSRCYNTTILYQANLDRFITQMESSTWTGTIL